MLNECQILVHQQYLWCTPQCEGAQGCTSAAWGCSSAA